MRILPFSSYLPTIRGLAANLVAGKHINPFYASFKITARCHFGCPFCNMKQHKTPDLSTDEIKAIIDNLSRSSVLMVSFEGGEPLLRDDIGELLAYTRSKKMYLLFTTSQRKLLEYPMQDYAQYIDFLHISMDEGHDNLEMFDMLPEITKLNTQVSVQTVVTRDTVAALEDKIERCYKAGANIVVIPASPMDGAEDCMPNMVELEKQVRSLKKKYPNTIHTPLGYFSALRKANCSPASLIIAPDGHLFYPCHILGHKGPDLRSTDLRTWLATPDAESMRYLMKHCDRNCGWYQYYAIDAYLSPASFFEAVGPMLFQKKRPKQGF